MRMGGERFMALFIGFVMVASILGFAMMRYTPEAPGPVKLPDVLNRTLTPEERVGVLRGGKVIIEYFHNGSCQDCAEKERMYMNFVDSFRGYVMLSYGVSNETADWMINLDGTQIDLSDVNSTRELRSLFCEVAIIKPNVCILEEI